MIAFLASLAFVTLAEMGDKTQLLAMAFATRYPAGVVLRAIFVATVLNHAMAVAAGRLLTSVVPLHVIALVAALSFILFGLWTIRGDALEGEDEARTAFGPFLTVAIAFFLAELGDKTQLATISLAVNYANPLAVLLGTTAGMVVADSIGIGVGIVLGARMPEALIRLVSAGVFIGFGLLGTAGVLAARLPAPAVAVSVFLLAAAALAAAHVLLLQRRRAEVEGVVPDGRTALPKRGAQALFAALLLLGWMAGLGVYRPLATVDHWIAFALLAGLGWKLIHATVRLRVAPPSFEAPAAALVLLLTALTAIRTAAAHVPLSLSAVPLILLGAAAGVLLAAPAIARRVRTKRLERVNEHRVALASGLLLFAVGTQILIEHLL